MVEILLSLMWPIFLWEGKQSKINLFSTVYEEK